MANVWCQAGRNILSPVLVVVYLNDLVKTMQIPRGYAIKQIIFNEFMYADDLLLLALFMSSQVSN